MQTFNKLITTSFNRFALSSNSARSLNPLKNRNFSILITPQDLRKKTGDQRPIILHSTCLEKDDKRRIYSLERIPAARLFDFDLISDKGSDIPRLLPQIGEFVKYMKSMGINANDEVVTYDDIGIAGGTRALWMLNVYGNNNVKVLDGGFQKWKELRKPLETGEETWIDQYHRGGEGFELQKHRIANIHEVRDFAYGKPADMELIDARNPDEFKGETHRGGHIPGSKNVPHHLLLESDNSFKKPEEIKKVFETAGINLSKSIICSCQNGMNSTILYAALRMLGKDDVAVYDGAWEEWSKFPENEAARIVDSTTGEHLHHA